MPTHQRHLPHLYQLDHPIFITFRLQGSLPEGRFFHKGAITSGKYFVCMDRLLDTNSNSPRYLQLPNVAECVVEAIQQQSATSYELHAWVVMPNHVHLLITPHVDVSKIMRQLKGSTARLGNALIGLTGSPFWQNESYDHLVRGAEEFSRIENYIVQNPVKAGLVEIDEEFRWSSAFCGVGLKSSAG